MGRDNWGMGIKEGTGWNEHWVLYVTDESFGFIGIMMNLITQYMLTKFNLNKEFKNRLVIPATEDFYKDKMRSYMESTWRKVVL